MYYIIIKHHVSSPGIIYFTLQSKQLIKSNLNSALQQDMVASYTLTLLFFKHVTPYPENFLLYSILTVSFLSEMKSYLHKFYVMYNQKNSCGALRYMANVLLIRNL